MIPKLVFIIPYRNRIQHKHFFDLQIKHVLEDISQNQYEIYYSHQNDERLFNRGAMKNIGFIAIKNKYPEDYKKITFVFNDIDCLPYTKNILYFPTTSGIVKHFYGFNHVLGGIVSITGEDFEKTNGFPNFWTWGYEDNVLNKRVITHNIKIDRTNFYPIHDPNILHFYHGNTRIHDLNQNDTSASKNNGITAIIDLNYEIDNENQMIQVTTFRIENDIKINKKNFKTVDLLNNKYMIDKKLRNQICKDNRFRMKI
tara:strand:+ start:6204 stop:6971 length:768 start_codon:yes stop_codon:yes gene_type:complete